MCAYTLVVPQVAHFGQPALRRKAYFWFRANVSVVPSASEASGYPESFGPHPIAFTMESTKHENWGKDANNEHTGKYTNQNL